MAAATIVALPSSALAFPFQLLQQGNLMLHPRNAWTLVSTTNQPSSRVQSVNSLALWTGTKFFLWGGATSPNVAAGDGKLYDPVLDTWTAVATSGAPGARMAHMMVWTGSKVIVWGGWTGGSNYGDGAIYDPSTNTWSAMSSSGAPSARNSAGAVWTGSKMIVWGGCTDGTCPVNDGGVYDLASDTWTAMTTTGAPVARNNGMQAFWTGTEMLVWGGDGCDDACPVATGGRYNPTTNTWTAITATNAPDARLMSSQVWTGSELIVWGGLDATGTAVSGTGKRYNPTTDTWTNMSATGAPTARLAALTVWTGAKMLLVGGQAYNGALFASGGQYDPVADSWSSVASAPVSRVCSDGGWNGTGLFVWGGSTNGVNPSNDCFYNTTQVATPTNGGAMFYPP
jgi:N-acetylneuraminic acid mutarotase